MSLFRNQVHQDIWIEHHCERCWHHPDCPILRKALTSDRKPVEWDRNTRKGALMQDTIKCNSETRTAPPRPKPLGIDVPMFDVTPTDATMDGDHA